MVAAAVVPFSAVWSVMAMVAGRPPDRTPTNVDNVRQYFDGSTVADGEKAPLRVVWQPSTASVTAPFNAMAIAGEDAILTSDAALTIVDLREGRLKAVLRLDGDGSPRIRRPHMAGPDASGDMRWVLASGHLHGLRVANGAVEVAEHLEVSSLTRSFYWVTRNDLVVNGPFEDGVLRRYHRTKAAYGSGDVMVQSSSTGDRLFPGLKRSIAMPLNETAMAARPRGDLIAVAFRWNDRVRVYRTSNLSLVRSIAGPAETFSTFAVMDREGTPTLAYGDDTAFSYVDVSADDDVLVALYASRDMRRHGAMRMAFGRELHVFTWDGRLVRRLYIDEDLRSAQIDPKTQTLYGLAWSQDKKWTIVAIDLSAVHAAARQAK